MERLLDPRDWGNFGLGCWAIGGPFSDVDGAAVGWGEVDDDESIAAIRRALELGVRVFDTADVYGAGRSERVLGKALGDRRGDVLVVSKFGNIFDEKSKILSGQSCEPDHIRAACEASLARLDTDYLDVMLLHMWDIEDEQVNPVNEVVADDEAVVGWIGKAQAHAAKLPPKKRKAKKKA